MNLIEIQGRSYPAHILLEQILPKTTVTVFHITEIGNI